MEREVEISELTDRFIAEFKRLKDEGVLPSNKEVAKKMKISAPGLSNILSRKYNIQSEQWKLFKCEYYPVQENSGNMANTNTPKAEPVSDKDQLLELLKRDRDRLQVELQDAHKRYATVEAMLVQLNANSLRFANQARANRALLKVVFQHIGLHREVTEKLPAGQVQRDMGIRMNEILKDDEQIGT